MTDARAGAPTETKKKKKKNFAHTQTGDISTVQRAASSRPLLYAGHRRKSGGQLAKSLFWVTRPAPTISQCAGETRPDTCGFAAREKRCTRRRRGCCRASTLAVLDGRAPHGLPRCGARATRTAEPHAGRWSAAAPAEMPFAGSRRSAAGYMRMSASGVIVARSAPGVAARVH